MERHRRRSCGSGMRSRAVCALAFAAALAACGSTTNPTSADDVYDNSYEGGPADLESVKHEYNADLADLSELLDQASSYEDQINAMEPVDQYSHYEVDTYNNLVSRYNAVADEYRFEARAFNEKYKAYADGAEGTVPTSPDAITLPDPIP